MESTKIPQQQDFSKIQETSKGLRDLFQSNKGFANSIDPDFLMKLNKGQNPKYLWIGCADSRVSPNIITQTKAVCGHYGCGGVQASIEKFNHRIVDNWISNLREIYINHYDYIKEKQTQEEQLERLVVLNTAYQVKNIGLTESVKNAWKIGQKIAVHGIIYGLKDALLRDLNITIESKNDLDVLITKLHRDNLFLVPYTKDEINEIGKKLYLIDLKEQLSPSKQLSSNQQNQEFGFLQKDLQTLDDLFQSNKLFSQSLSKEKQLSLSKSQNPKYLWIGCADSRVPPNIITNTGPGDLFIHRNIGNQVITQDLNLLSIVQYAVENLKIKHIIVGGHYGCQGIQAAFSDKYNGIFDNWLEGTKEIIINHQQQIQKLEGEEQQMEKLVEISIAYQVKNLGMIECVKNAWENKQELYVYGLVYSLKEGLLRDLNITLENSAEVQMLTKKLHRDELNLKAYSYEEIQQITKKTFEEE